MAGLRKYDAFVKARPDMRTRSVVGGIITIVASTSAFAMILGQLMMYIIGNPEHSLHLAKSKSTPIRPLNLTPLQSRILDRIGSIPLQLRVTFPHVSCHRLDFAIDGASLSSGEMAKHHPGHSFELRKPTVAELSKITNGRAFHGHITQNHGCTVDGHLRINVVAGSLVLGLNSRAWSEVTAILSIRRLEGSEERFKSSMMDFNVTHFIHYLKFGEPFVIQDRQQPLENRYNLIENNFGGLALEQLDVKLVPTHKSTLLPMSHSSVMYQASVNDHQVEPATLVSHGVPHLPGLLIAYDFSPIAVSHHGGRDNILVFISSLVSIVGGVFVTMGMLTSCLVHSAKAVAKKVD